MKIIQISSYYPPHLGGGDNVVRSIAEGLAKKGHEVNVFTSDIGLKLGKIKRLKNLNVEYLKSFEIAHSSIPYLLFFKLLTIPKEAIMHVSVGHVYVPEVVMLVSKITKIPYVCHFHIDVDPSGRLGFLLKYYKKYILKHVLNKANAVICLTEQQKKFLHNTYQISLNKLFVVSNGVSKEYFFPLKNKNTKPYRLLFVGRLVKQKNIQLMINSIPYIKNEVYFDIVGDGEDKKILNDLINKLSLKNVKIRGLKTGSNLLNFYKHAKIFLMTSTNEGMSLSLLEAMAAGLPFVANKNLNTDPYLKDGGVFLKTQKPQELANVIDQLITNENIYSEKSIYALKYAKNFTWETCVGKVENVYKAVKQKK